MCYAIIMNNQQKTQFKKGHIPWITGRNKETDEICKKISDGKMGSKNPMWKGDEVGYVAMHDWVNRHKPKPDLCECCDKEKPRDLANISGEYMRDLSDWEWLCRRCHMIKDGRINNLKKYTKKIATCLDCGIVINKRSNRCKKHSALFREEIKRNAG